MSGKYQNLNLEKCWVVLNRGNAKTDKIPQNNFYIAPKAPQISLKTNKSEVKNYKEESLVPSCISNPKSQVAVGAIVSTNQLENISIVSPRSLVQPCITKPPVKISGVSEAAAILPSNPIKNVNLLSKNSKDSIMYQLIHLTSKGPCVAKNRIMDHEAIPKILSHEREQILRTRTVDHANLIIVDSNGKFIKSQEIEINPQGKVVIKDDLAATEFLMKQAKPSFESKPGTSTVSAHNVMINKKNNSTRVSPQTYKQSVNLNSGTSAAACPTEIAPEAITTSRQSATTGVQFESKTKAQLITITSDSKFISAQSIEIGPDNKVVYICKEPGTTEHRTKCSEFESTRKLESQSTDRKLLKEEEPQKEEAGPSGLQKSNNAKNIHKQQCIGKYKIPVFPEVLESSEDEDDPDYVVNRVKRRKKKRKRKNYNTKKSKN